jgi:hypothetical protein
VSWVLNRTQVQNLVSPWATESDASTMLHRSYFVLTTVRVKIMPLPSAVTFEGRTDGKYHYRQLGFRPPKKGEFYLSGAIVVAYLAPNDLSTSYQVVEPTTPAYTMVRHR